MKNARDEFGPPSAEVMAQHTQNLHDLNGVQQIRQDMGDRGIIQDGEQAQLKPVKQGDGSPAAHKDKGVTHGERPALSPCDGKLQADTLAQVKAAGQTLKDAGTVKSASQEFAPPAATPKAPSPPSQGKSR